MYKFVVKDLRDKEVDRQTDTAKQRDAHSRKYSINTMTIKTEQETIPSRESLVSAKLKDDVIHVNITSSIFSTCQKV